MRSVIIRVLLTIAAAVLLLAIGTMSLSCAQPINLADIEATQDYPYIEDPLDFAWRETSHLNYYHDGPFGYWQSPHETMSRGGGDCEDIATVLVYRLGREASRVSIKKHSTGTYHSVVLYKGRYLESQEYGKYLHPSSFTVRKVYPYDVVMKASTGNSTK